MLTYISIFVTAIFVNNIVLSQFLGICPFLGVSKRIDSSLGMGAAVTFVMTIAIKKPSAKNAPGARIKMRDPYSSG